MLLLNYQKKYFIVELTSSTPFRTWWSVVEKPFDMYPGVPSEIPGSSSLWDATLSCGYMTLAVGGTLNTFSLIQTYPTKYLPYFLIANHIPYFNLLSRYFVDKLTFLCTKWELINNTCLISWTTKVSHHSYLPSIWVGNHKLYFIGWTSQDEKFPSMCTNGKLIYEGRPLFFQRMTDLPLSQWSPFYLCKQSHIIFWCSFKIDWSTFFDKLSFSAHKGELTIVFSKNNWLTFVTIISLISW